MRTLIRIAIVIAVLCAGSISSAQAAEFHSESETTTIKGAQVDSGTFGVAGMNISCKGASYEGVQSGKAANEMVLTPSYSECSFLFFNVNVNLNGCKYRIHTNGKVDIVGASCNGITYEGAGCKFVIPAQTGLGSLTYSTVGSGAEEKINIAANLTGIKYTASGLCAETGTKENGSYHAASTNLTGFSGGVEVGVSYN